MATRVTGGRAGTMPGPRLAYVALVTTVFGPFRPFNNKTFQSFVSNRRSSYVWRYVVARGGWKPWGLLIELMKAQTASVVALTG